MINTRRDGLTLARPSTNLGAEVKKGCRRSAAKLGWHLDTGAKVLGGSW